MRIEYNEYQATELKNRMSFLKSMRTCMLIITGLFFGLIVAGAALIYYNLAFLGIVLIIVGIIPLLMSFSVLKYAITLISSINKRKYSCYEVECKTSQQIEGNGMWQEITVGDKNNKIHHFSETPHQCIEPGTIVHVIVCHNKTGLMFSVNPIDSQPEATESNENTDDKEKAE